MCARRKWRGLVQRKGNGGVVMKNSMFASVVMVLINRNMTSLHLRKSTNYSPLRRACIFVPLVLMCFGLSPRLQAVTPTPDGAYLGANTAEGGVEPSLASQRVPTTRLLVLKRSLVLALVSRIRPSELKPSETTGLTTTLPMVFKRLL